MDAPKSVGARLLLLLGFVVMIGFMTVKMPTLLRVAVVLGGLSLAARMLYEHRAGMRTRLSAMAIGFFSLAIVSSALSRLLRYAMPTFAGVLEWLDPAFLCAAGLAALVQYVRNPEKSAVKKS